MQRAQEWSGTSYDRISAPQETMGQRVLERMDLRGDETILDAGCGSGRVTELLLERLPHGRVIAVDASESMIAAARERLLGNPALAGRVSVIQADLLEVRSGMLGVTGPIDGILSTATFHWIADHQRLFTRLRALLRPGGQLVAQCGGEGNDERLMALADRILLREPYASAMRGFVAPWNFAAPPETERQLRLAGFEAARAWLEPSPQLAEHGREFLETIIFKPQVSQLPEELREAFMDEVMAVIDEPVVVDFMRLNIDARA